MASRSASIIITATRVTKPYYKPTMAMHIREVTSANVTAGAITSTTTSSKLSIINKKEHEGPTVHALYPSEGNSDTDSLPFTFRNRVYGIKTNVARELKKCGHLESLIIIDSIKRLGIEHYFKKEISDVLKRSHAKWSTTAWKGGDLYEDALRFRLLREMGYHVPSDIFRNFKDKNGKFRVEIRKDIRGLISLFEASQLSIPGDDLLDYAGEYSEQLLLASLKDVKQSEARIIGNILNNPHHKSLPKVLDANSLIQNFKTTLELVHAFHNDKDWVQDVQDLVITDFNMAQITYQDEIFVVTRWWKELQLTKNMELARDQPVKWHMWSVVALPDLNMTEERIELTKVVSLIYIIDDIFDLYGTLQELTAFTEAVNKWNYVGIEGLPDYMKMCLEVLYNFTHVFSHKTYSKHGLNSEDSLRKIWADLCNAFLVERRWFASGYLPPSEEYLNNAIISTGVPLVFVHAFLLLGESIRKDEIDLLIKYPDILTSVATILRLWDDLGSAKNFAVAVQQGALRKMLTGICFMKVGTIVRKALGKAILRPFTFFAVLMILVISLVGL